MVIAISSFKSSSINSTRGTSSSGISLERASFGTQLSRCQKMCPTQLRWCCDPFMAPKLSGMIHDVRSTISLLVESATLKTDREMIS
ncbi:unnamed protein product [Musa acuminata subsp. malaccensis]|nr:unnamed protein product [Musa acuminata subsp. malaccensis]